MSERPDRLWALQFAAFVVVIVCALCWVKRHADQIDGAETVQKEAGR